mgnify:CR=1 FL=1
MTTGGIGGTITINVHYIPGAGGAGGRAPGSGIGTPRFLSSKWISLPEAIVKTQERLHTKQIMQQAKAAVGGPGILNKTFSFLKSVGGLLGIGITLAALLKNSKIASATLGTFFQIVGAMIDVLLAPFIPMIAKWLQKMADKIPQIAEWAQRMAPTIIETLKEFKPVLLGIWEVTKTVWNIMDKGFRIIAKILENDIARKGLATIIGLLIAMKMARTIGGAIGIGGGIPGIGGGVGMKGGGFGSGLLRKAGIVGLGATALAMTGAALPEPKTPGPSGYGESTGQAAKSIAKDVAKGAIIGATIGSVVPVIGTILGGLIGAPLGALAGLSKRKFGVNIPGFQLGGVAPGGPILVGERGPELVNLPRGAMVTPRERSSSRGGGNVVNQNITINMADPGYEYAKLQARVQRERAIREMMSRI